MVCDEVSMDKDEVAVKDPMSAHDRLLVNNLLGEWAPNRSYAPWLMVTLLRHFVHLVV